MPLKSLSCKAVLFAVLTTSFCVPVASAQNAGTAVDVNQMVDQAAAKGIAREGLDALVVDISARASREGGQLADAMRARYLALPRADAKTLHAAISATTPSREPA